MTVAMGFFPYQFFWVPVAKGPDPQIVEYLKKKFFHEIPGMIAASVYTFKIYYISWLLWCIRGYSLS